jgi:hypothetical protein
MTDADEDRPATSPATHRADYPNVAEWLNGAAPDHWWVRLLDTERLADAKRPTWADMALEPLEVLIRAVRTTAPPGLEHFVRDRFRDPDPANLLSARLELLCAAHLAIPRTPFAFGGTGEADLTWYPGTDEQGWMEIHRGAFSVFDAVQRDIEAELATTNATLEVRVSEWPLEVDQRNVLLTRVSQAINSAVASGSEQLIGLPEIGSGVMGTVRSQGQELLGLSRVTVRHGSLMPSDDYLVRFGKRLTHKVNVGKAGQARRGAWDQQTVLLIDISTAHLTRLLGQDGIATWLDGVAIEWDELPFAGVAVCFSDLNSVSLGGVCRYKAGLANAERGRLEPTLTALGLPATQ